MAPVTRSGSSMRLYEEEEGRLVLERPVTPPRATGKEAEGPSGDPAWNGDADVYSVSQKSTGMRAWNDPCVSSNAFILWVSWFLYYCRNMELSILAFLLFCASMAYHRSGETRYMALDVALGRLCCLYYIVSTSYWSTWSVQESVLIMAGYAAFCVIIALTTGKQALAAHTDRYTRVHPLVHILGIIPPMVGGVVCRPFIM